MDFCDWLNSYNGSGATAVSGLVDLTRRRQRTGEREGEAGAGGEQQEEEGLRLRGNASVIAWRKACDFDPLTGTIVVLASHTDSPCLRTRPRDRVSAEGCELLGVATYGGGLWHTWFDRPLAAAGTVTFKKPQGQLATYPIRIAEAIAVVPNLCIHLQDREAAQTFKPQPEQTLRPVLQLSSPSKESPAKSDDFSSALALADYLGARKPASEDQLLSYDLCLYDAAPAQIFGLKRDMLSAPGLDNKTSAWATFKAFGAARLRPNTMYVCVAFDHEEIGSVSAAGAASDLLETTLNELLGRRPNWDKALILSCDAAHAVHPNYSDKHQTDHKPLFNRGVAVKVNANQRYATDSQSLAFLRNLACVDKKVLLQEYVVRNDTPCGSTIGPILSAKLGCRTVDVGIPIWAMHSCRETCGAEDIHHLEYFAQRVLETYEAASVVEEHELLR